MKTLPLVAATVVLLLATVAAAEEADRTNFIVFLTDDQG